MNYEFNGSPSDIEKQLDHLRSEFSDNVQKLYDRVHPKALADDAKVQAQAKYYQVRKFTLDTWYGAREGDSEAQRNLAIAAAGVAAAVGLIVWRIARR